MRGCSIAFTLLTLLFVSAGCGVGGSATTQGGMSSASAPIGTPTSVTVQDYATLVTALTAAGATVQPGQEHPPNIIFDAPSRDMLVNGSVDLSVYEYPASAAAKA